MERGKDAGWREGRGGAGRGGAGRGGAGRGGAGRGGAGRGGAGRGGAGRTAGCDVAKLAVRADCGPSYCGAGPAAGQEMTNILGAMGPAAG